MCLDPLEISYSHIAVITLQDAPNVISQGFSNSILQEYDTNIKHNGFLPFF